MSETDGIPNPDRGSVGQGIALAVLLHLCQLLLMPSIFGLTGWLLSHNWMAPNLQAFGILGWSITQFLYLGPAAWILYKKGKRDTMIGVLMTAGIGVLLNGACDAMLLSP